MFSPTHPSGFWETRTAKRRPNLDCNLSSETQSAPVPSEARVACPRQTLLWTCLAELRQVARMK